MWKAQPRPFDANAARDFIAQGQEAVRPQQKSKIPPISRAELQKKPLEELETLRDDMEEAMAKIRLQLANAKAKVITHGEYADPGWYNAAEFALKMKGRDHQWLLREISTRRKADRHITQDSLEQRFIQAARRRLDPDLFADLLREAQEEGQHNQEAPQ